MPLGTSVRAAACVILCFAASTWAQSPNRPAPIASTTETTVVDGGLGTAPPIALPRVENAPSWDASANLSRPFAQTMSAQKPQHFTNKLLRIGFGGMIPMRPADPSANGKLGLKGLLMHRTAEAPEPEPSE